MRGYIPPRPSGTTREARFDQAVWDALWGPESRIVNSSTIKVSKTSMGVELKSKPTTGAPSSTCDLYG